MLRICFSILSCMYSLHQQHSKGLLRRARITARQVIPIGKETDRSWEQGEDPSLVDFKVKESRKTKRWQSPNFQTERNGKRLGFVSGYANPV
jgi:hypothetical protein